MAGFRNSSLGHMALPKLTKSNYDNWSIQIKALLGAQDVWDVVENEFVEPVTLQSMTAQQLKALKE